jgi:hypothetical protein
MRWKLLVLVSFVAALLALGLWSAFTIAVFGSARMPQNNWLLLCGLVIPLGVTTYAGVFVYRHTAKRRKLQALIAIVLVLLLTAASYLIAASLFLRGSTLQPVMKCATPCGLSRTCLLFPRSQSNLFLHRFQRIDHELNMLVEFDVQLNHALMNIIAID